MADKEIDPSDIGKFPELIKTAQKEMATNDVFVCGECHSSYNFIQEFQAHKESNKCPKESTLKECKDPKPKVWAFLLWKASHLNNSENRKPNFPPWTLYQKWTKLDESVRETWIVAGKTIQSFVKMGQGSLQEMPVKITKTVVDSVTKNQENQKTPPTLPVRSGVRQTISKPLAEKSENEGGARKAQAVTRPAAPEIRSPVVAASSAPKTKSAKRTMSDQSVTDHDVEKILAKRFNPRRKIHEYLVKWENVPHDQNSWEPFTHLGTVKHLVDVFEVQLAKQKEQRNQAAAAAAAKPALPPPAIRPERNAKINALDQVSKWLTDEDGIGGAKRKHSDDSDFHDTDEDEMSELDVSSPKKTKMDFSSSSSVISDKGGAKTRLMLKPAEKKPQENAAEVVLTKSKSTGVVRKTNNSPAQVVSGETTLNEAQIRIVQKGEAVPTGVVRIIPTTSPKRPVAPPKTGAAGPKVVTATSKATTNLMKSLPSSTTIRQVQKPGATVSPRVVTTAKSPQQQQAVAKKVAPPARPTTGAQTTTTVGRTLVSRVVKPTPKPSTMPSEEKIMSLSRQGSLRVTKRVAKDSDEEDGIEDLFKTMEAAPPTAHEEEEEELPMTLCPLTGQVLGQAEGEPDKEPEEAVAADPAEVQQLLTNEDGTPLIVTGEDGTIYQVAGKNANGQTVLIAQGGAEGEQPVVLLANDGDEETGLQFATTEDDTQMAQQTVAGTEIEAGEEGTVETAPGEEGQIVHTEGGQQLTIQTEEEGQITAEIVQAELPSPGGTRRVVLLLPDGSLMMTEVNEEQYQSLNLNT